EVATRIFNQINGFADYGFPESHAASFALIVYASAYLRHYYAPEFLTAMLNAQPMGFYSAGTLVEDAKRHGVRMLPVDVTRSAWDHTLECADGTVVVPHDGVITVHRDAARTAARKPPLVRLGLRSIRGLGSNARGHIQPAVQDGPLPSTGARCGSWPSPARSTRSCRTNRRRGGGAWRCGACSSVCAAMRDRSPSFR